MPVTTDPNRPWRVALFATVLVTAIGMGLVLALWGPGAGLMVAKVAGAAGIVCGLFLLLSPTRYLFTKERGVSPEVQIPAAQMLGRQMRISGATGVLMGIGILIPDASIRAAFMLCAAAVSIAGVLKRPRSLFRTP